MRIGFYLQVYESLAVEYLSACLRQAGHEVCLFYDPKLGNDLNFQNRYLAKWLDLQDALVEEMANADLDLAGFSVVTDTYATSLRAARKLKARTDVPTVFGGIHVTSVPKRVVQEDAVDYVVVGEGEEAIVDLADALAAGRPDTDIANVGSMRNGEPVVAPPRPLVGDLDALPFPDKDLFYGIPGMRKTSYTIMASRGCPFSCTYCNNSLMKRLYEGKGTWRRWRSVDNVIAELVEARKKYPIDRVHFWDENFVDNRKWLAELLDRYRNEVGLPFAAWASPQHVDEEMVRQLEQAGCVHLSIGVQTIYESTRETILHRFHTNEKLAEAMDAVKASPIALETSCIVQLPEQSIEEIEDMARFLNEHRADACFAHFLRYYPGTDIVGIARERNMLGEEEIEAIEAAREERSFAVRSEQDDRTVAKLRFLLIVTRVLPKGLVTWLLKERRYRYLPKGGAMVALLQFTEIFRTLTFQKGRFKENFTNWQYFLHVMYFTWKKLRWKMGLSTGKPAPVGPGAGDLQSNGPGA